MWQRGSNIAGGDSRDIDGDSSIEPKNTEERGNHVVDGAEERQRGNPVVHDGGESFISTHVQEQACNTEQGIRVRDHLAKIIGSRLNKYKGVENRRGQWLARVWKRRDDGQKTGANITLGTFPTAEMAAIAYDAAVFHLKGDSCANRFNFPHYVCSFKSTLKGFSPSKTNDNLRRVAWKAASTLAAIISQKQKHKEIGVSAPMYGAISSATSALMSSSNTGTSDSTHKADFPVIPLQAKEQIKEAAVPDPGSISTKGYQQQPTEIHDDQQETTNNINKQIQHAQPRSRTSAPVDSGIFSLSSMHEALRECSIPADTLQDAAIPTSNPNSMLESYCGVVGFHSNLIPAGTSDSTHNADFPVIPLQEKKCIMPVEIEISGGLDEVEEDNYMDSFIEYPLRHSPECVLLRPVPGANTHPDYVFKK